MASSRRYFGRTIVLSILFFTVNGLFLTYMCYVHVLYTYNDAVKRKDLATAMKMVEWMGSPDGPPIMRRYFPLLPEAAEAGNVELCRALLERGADPERRNILGHTARRNAKVNGHKAVVALFDSYRRDIARQR